MGFATPSAVVIRFNYSWSHPAKRTTRIGLAVQNGFTKSSLTQYRCEICGTESSNPMHDSMQCQRAQDDQVELRRGLNSWHAALLRRSSCRRLYQPLA